MDAGKNQFCCNTSFYRAKAPAIRKSVKHFLDLHSLCKMLHLCVLIFHGMFRVKDNNLFKFNLLPLTMIATKQRELSRAIWTIGKHLSFLSRLENIIFADRNIWPRKPGSPQTDRECQNPQMQFICCLNNENV